MYNKGIKRVLSIAGSDSGGGAGIQADLKTFSALGCHGMTAITAVTAQNTCEVIAIHDVPPAIVALQIRAVMEDIGVDAVKIGMLSNPQTVAAVAETLKAYAAPNIVLDPVMVSKSGDPLLHEDAIEALRTLLAPLATVMTPNLPEARVLAGRTNHTGLDHKGLLVSLHALGSRYVLLKGGHAQGQQVVDLLYDGRNVREYASARIDTKNTHGTGCTLSSAIAGYIALGHTVEEAVHRAKIYVTGAIEHGATLGLGKGCGPLCHHWMTLTT